MGWSLIHPASQSTESNPAPRNFSKESYWKWLSKREGSTKALKSYGENRLAKAWSRLEAVELGGKGQGSHSTLKHGMSEADGRSISIQFQIKKKLAFFPFNTSLGWKTPASLKKGVPAMSPFHLITTALSEAFFSDPGKSSSKERDAPSMFKPYWQGRISGKPQ